MSRRAGKTKNIFLSPLSVQKGPFNRISKVTFKVATAGETAVMTLTYPGYQIAKDARAALLSATNAYAVANEALWRAIAESIQGVSPDDN